MENVSRQIKDYKLDTGITFFDLATQTGFSISYLEKVCNGHRSASRQLARVMFEQECIHLNKEEKKWAFGK